MQLGIGAPSVTVNINDFSVAVSTGIKGITGMLIVTERGPLTPTLVGSWSQYQEVYGGLMSGYDGPLYARRALDSGAKLIIQRAMKYANPADPSTVASLSAGLTIAQTVAAAVGAIANVELLTVTTNTSVTLAAQIPGQPNVALGTASLTVAGPIGTNVTAMVSAINAGTATHNFSATAGTGGKFTVTCPTTLGDYGNTVVILVQVDATEAQFVSYSAKAAGGADAKVASSLDMDAANPGAWGNNVKVEVQYPVSKDTTKVDLVVSLTGSTTMPTEYFRDVPKKPTTADLVSVFAGSRMIGSVEVVGGFVFQAGSTTMTGGADTNISAPLDYIGDQTAGTNLYAFDSQTAMTKLCIPEVADTAVMAKLADYADFRQDIIALHRSPIGLNPQTEIQFRNCSGPYTGIPVDSWRSFLFSGGLLIPDPITGLPKQISEIGDVVGVFGRKDTNYFEWTAFAGEKYGRISNALDVVVNVGTPGRKTDADNYDVAGIIPVVKKLSSSGLQQIRIDGNTNMYGQFTMLKKSEVSELLVYIHRMFNRVIPPNFFQPNDVETWKNIYRAVAVNMEYIKENRGIWDYFYQGDQDIDNISQCVINNPAEVDLGVYRFNLGIKPKVALKYVIINVNVVSSGVSFASVTVQ